MISSTHGLLKGCRRGETTEKLFRCWRSELTTGACTTVECIGKTFLSALKTGRMMSVQAILSVIRSELPRFGANCIVSWRSREDCKRRSVPIRQRYPAGWNQMEMTTLQAELQSPMQLPAPASRSRYSSDNASTPFHFDAKHNRQGFYRNRGRFWLFPFLRWLPQSICEGTGLD